MNITISNQNRFPGALDCEIVERKGKGHPDTLADRLAEKLSITYSRLTKERFGIILRHQFDKLSLLGGRCNVSFGKGNFQSPVRLLLNGRATPQLGNEKVDFKDLLLNECELFLESELKNFNFFSDCRVIFETSSNSTRGLIDNTGIASINYRFQPRTVNDLPEFSIPLSNDTALGYGFAPYTTLEKLVLDVETTLTSEEKLTKHPWLGTDIKIMGCRTEQKIELTLAVPQICTEVNSKQDYKNNYYQIEKMVADICSKYSGYLIRAHINPSDELEKDLIYMRYTGSCVESGDEGVVGRGNRIGGVISACRSYSIEGLNGKNPMYHAGKIYSAAAWEIANKIWQQTNQPCEVFLISQIDRPLNDPWKIIINGVADLDSNQVQSIVESIVGNLKQVTNNFLDAAYPIS